MAGELGCSKLKVKDLAMRGKKDIKGEEEEDMITYEI